MKANRESGVALIVMLLFISVVLVAILVGTTQLSLGNRRGVANEVAAYRAVLTSESGLNAFNYRQLKYKQLPGSLPEACREQVNDAVRRKACETAIKTRVDTWLTSAVNTGTAGDTVLGQLPLTDGTVVLSVLSVEVTAKPIPSATTVNFVMSGIDVQATSTVNGSQGRVVQRFSASATDLPMPGVGAALTSYPSVKYGGAGDIAGVSLTSPSNDGILNAFARGTVSFASPSVTALTLSTPVKFDISSSAKANLPTVGSYIRLPVNTSLTTTGTGVFRVTENDGGKLTTQPVSLPGVSGMTLPSGNVDADYVVNAVKAYDPTSPFTLNYNAKEAFYVGDKIAVKEFPTGTVKTGTITAVGSGTQATIAWDSGWPAAVAEGSAIVKNVYAVASAFTVDRVGSGGAPVGGEKASSSDLVPSPLNNTLFLKTFGMTPTEMRSMADIVPRTQIMDVSGLSWVDASTANPVVKLSGSGITIFTGDVTLNKEPGPSTTACKYRGLIYVRGNLNIQGNVGICGAIVAEGTVTSSDGTAVTGVDIDNPNDATQVLGNGLKISYDIDAIIDATSGLGSYAFTPRAGTWRQR